VILVRILTRTPGKSDDRVPARINLQPGERRPNTAPAGKMASSGDPHGYIAAPDILIRKIHK
jgi:hypothetical protein